MRAGSAIAFWRSHTSILLTLACCTALLLVGIAWALASPIGATDDEDFHLASIWCDAGDPLRCRRTGVAVEEGIERALVVPEFGPNISCWGQQWDASAGCQTEIRVQEEQVQGRMNDGLYPGGFYWLMSVFASSNIDRSVVLMRIVSWVLAISLLLCASLLASRDLRRAFTIGIFVTLVPMGVFLFASTNPSGLAIAGVAAYWCAAHTFMSLRPARGRTAAAVVALAIVGFVLAIGSRSDAGIFLAVASLAVWISTAGYRRALWPRSALLAGIGGAGLATVLRGTQSQRWAGELGVQDENSLAAKLFEGALELPRHVLGALGPAELVWTPLPPVVSILMLLAFGGVVLVGLGAASGEKWLSLAVLVGASVGLAMVVLVSGQNLHARYLLPLLPVVASTALLSPLVGSKVVIQRGQALVIGAAVIVAHGAALHRNIRRFVTGIDEGGPDLGESVEWWWSEGPGPMVVWLVGSCAFALALLCALALVTADDEARRKVENVQDQRTER